MKTLLKISLQFFADVTDQLEQVEQSEQTEQTEQNTLAQITAEYDRKLKELETALEKANADLKASNDALNRIIDNRTSSASADTVTANIKKLLK